MTTGTTVGDILALPMSDEQQTLLVDALQAAATPFLICDPRLPGVPVVWVNEAFCRLTGFAPEDVLGQAGSFLTGPATDAELVPRLREAVGEPQARVEGLLYRKDGSTFWSEIVIATAQAPDGALLSSVLIVNDISAERIRERLTGARLAASGLLAEADALGPVLEALPERLGSNLDVGLVDIWTQAGPGAMLERRSGWVRSLGSGGRAAMGLLDQSQEAGIAARAWSARRTIRLDDVSKASELGVPAELDLRSLIAVPIVVNERVIAVVRIGLQTAPVEEAIALALEDLAREVGAFGERELRDGQIRVRERQQSLAAELGRLALMDAPEGAITAAAALAIQRGLGVSQGWVLHTAGDGDGLTVSGVAGVKHIALGAAAGRWEELSRRLRRSNGELSFDPDTPLSGLPLIAQSGAVAGIAVPIGSALKPAGLLLAASTQPLRLGREESAFLWTISNLLGVAAETRDARLDLEASERRLQLATDASGTGVWEQDLDSRVLWFNDVVKTLFGYDRHETVTPAMLSARWHPDDTSTARGLTPDEIPSLGTAAEEQEFRIVLPDASVRWLLRRGEVVRDASGAARSMIGTLIDVTESREAEATLRASAERLRLALEAARLGYWEEDVDTGAFIVSDGLRSMLGFPAGVPVTQHMVLQRLHPDDRAMVLAAVADRLEQGDRSEQFRMLDADQSVIWVEFRGHKLRAPDGHVNRILAMIIDVSQRRRGEQELSDTGARLQLALDAAQMGWWDQDRAQGAFTASPGLRSVLRMPEDRPLPDMTLLDRIHPEDRNLARLLFSPRSGDGPVSGGTVRFLDGDDDPRWIEVRLQRFTDSHGAPTRTIGLCLDVSAIRRAQESAIRSERRYLDVLEAIELGAVSMDPMGSVTFANPAFCRMMGWDLADIVGHDFFDLFVPHSVRDERRERFRAGMQTRLPLPLTENRILTRSGIERLLRFHNTAIRNADGVIIGITSIAEDITEARAQDEQLRYLAEHDPLTSLPNRSALERALAATVAASIDGSHAALLYVDIDHLKVVNDTLGHAAGDRLIAQIGRRLGQTAPPNALVSRWGGDEFVILLPETDRDRALTVGQQVRESIAALRSTETGAVFDPRASIGIAMIVPGQSAEDALGHADAACYAAKTRGRNRIEVFEPGASEVQRLAGAARETVELRNALEAGRVSLVYQPIASTRDGAIHHVEALSRLHEPSGAIVLPEHFIPAAESVGMIVELDRWVIGTVIDAIAAQRAAGRQSPAVAVNVSATTLRDDGLPAWVAGRLATNGVSGTDVIVEITETALMSDLVQVRHVIEALRRLGVRFSLDDFGSGFASFAYLAELPLDYLKIDGSFVRDVASNEVSRAIVCAINDLAHSTGKQSIAEWVETGEALDVLRDIGVDFAQGWHVGRPQAGLAALAGAPT